MKHLLILLLAIICPVALFSQTYKFEYPVPNQTNVPLQPIIKFKIPKFIGGFPAKIDTSRIRHQYPYPDSSIVNCSVDPTVILVEKTISDSGNALTERILRVAGTYSLANDTVIQFTPTHPLKPLTQYRYKIANLWAVRFGPMIDTVQVSYQEMVFTTGYGVPFYIIDNFSLENGKRCDDTLKVFFSAPLLSTSTSAGPLVKIERIDSYSYPGDTLATKNLSSPLSVSSWLSGDGMTILVKPTFSLDAGKEYLVTVAADQLNGDTLQHKELVFHVPEYNIVTLGVDIQDTSFSGDENEFLFPGLGINSFALGDTFSITAKPTEAGYVFSHWESSNGALDSVTDYTLNLSYDCDNVQTFDLTAIYIKHDSINVTVTDSNNVSCLVYDEDMNYLGGAGVYRLAPDKFIYVQAVPDSGYEFTQWETQTTGALIHRGEYNSLRFGIGNRGRDVGINPFDPTGPVFIYYCISVWGTLPNNTICYPGPRLTIDPYNYGGSSPMLKNVYCGLFPEDRDCYDIVGYYDNGVYVELPTPVDEFEGDFMTQMPCRRIQFIVEPVGNYDLEVHTVLNKGLLMDGEIGRLKDVTIRVTIQKACESPQTYYTEATPNPLVFNDLPCGTKVTVTALWNIREDGFAFLNWEDASGWEHPTPKEAYTHTFVMNGDKKVKGFFQEYFRLRQIGVYRKDNNGNVALQYYTTKQWKTMLRNIEVRRDFSSLSSPPSAANDDGYETKMFFRFNDEVYEPSLSYQIFAQDQTPRVDMQYSSYTRYMYELRSGNYQNEDGGVGKLWSFEVNNQHRPRAIPKGEEFLLYVGTKTTSGHSNIRNTSSPPLYLINPGQFSGETECPGIFAELVSVTGLETSGDGGLEIDLTYVCRVSQPVDGQAQATVEEEEYGNYAGYVGVVSKVYTYPGNPIDMFWSDTDHDYYDIFNVGTTASDIDGASNDVSIPAEVLAIGGALAGGLAGILAEILDDDDEELDNPLEPYQDSFWTYLSAFLTGALIGGLAGTILGILLAPLLEAAINWILGLFAGLGEDDPLGMLAWFFGWGNSMWWGAHESVKNAWIKSNEYLKQEIRIRLKKSEDPTDTNLY